MGRISEMHIAVAIVTVAIGNGYINQSINGERRWTNKYTSDFNAWI